MKRKLPPFPALRAFESAARLGSFKDAADELCVTASAISHQIRTLETFLGRAMFLRGARQVTLTEDGKIYLAQIGPVLDQLDASTRLIVGETCAGTLHLQMTEGFMRRWLMPRLGRFMAQYPDLDVQMEPWLPPTVFEGGRPDIIVHWGDEPVSGIDVKPLLSSTRIPLCSPDYLAAHPDLARPDALLGKTLLRDAVDDGWPEWFGLIGREADCPDGGPVFAHCELSMTAAEAGLGVVLGFTDMLDETLARGTLVAPFDLKSPTRTIYSIACESARAHEPKIVAFRDWLFEEVIYGDLSEPRTLSAAQ